MLRPRLFPAVAAGLAVIALGGLYQRHHHPNDPPRPPAHDTLR